MIYVSFASIRRNGHTHISYHILQLSLNKISVFIILYTRDELLIHLTTRHQGLVIKIKQVVLWMGLQGGVVVMRISVITYLYICIIPYS